MRQVTTVLSAAFVVAAGIAYTSCSKKDRQEPAENVPAFMKKYDFKKYDADLLRKRNVIFPTINSLKEIEPQVQKMMQSPPGFREIGDKNLIPNYAESIEAIRKERIHNQAVWIEKTMNSRTSNRGNRVLWDECNPLENPENPGGGVGGSYDPWQINDPWQDCPFTGTNPNDNTIMYGSAPTGFSNRIVMVADNGGTWPDVRITIQWNTSSSNSIGSWQINVQTSNGLGGWVPGGFSMNECTAAVSVQNNRLNFSFTGSLYVGVTIGGVPIGNSQLMQYSGVILEQSQYGVSDYGAGQQNTCH
ncbi:MAG TPA: hypothetical protein VNR87_16390 [Flavisolibacter sp.]|nr:hypothetical protein [Flavisolibacter sp.]